MVTKDSLAKKGPIRILALGALALCNISRKWLSLGFCTIFAVMGLLYPSGTSTAAATKLSIEFSKNFSAKALAPGLIEVHVKNPWKGAGREFCYLLKDKSLDLPKILQPKGQKCLVIDVPVKRIIVLSSTYYAMLDAIGAVSLVVGASRPQRANTPSFVLGYKTGRIKDVGDGLNINVEGVLALDIDVIFTYATGGFRDIHPKLEEAGLNVVLCAEYMENHPLGRAEWVKFFGLFTGHYNRAKEIFDSIRDRYLHLKKQASKTKKRPTVMTNTPFAGQWFVPGGRSFMAKFIKDAGGNYVFHDLSEAGTIPMDLELAYQRGKNADFWINTGAWSSLSEIAQTDPRLMAFKAVKERKVFNNNLRVNNLGGNDYWESGALRPDLILADLIAIFHPRLLPGHKLYYYRQLQ